MLAYLLLQIAQSPAPADLATELEAHVRLLADDALEGRRAGTFGADQAAAYLAGTLAAAGLQPAGQDGGWFQSFEVELAPRPGSCWLRVEGHDDDWRTVGTLALSATAEVSAALVDAGYGVVLESHGMNEYADAGVGGKIALVRRYTEFGPDADAELASLGELRTKIRGAVEAGAVGVVVGTDPRDLARGGKASIAFDAAPGSMPIPVVTVSPGQMEKLTGLLQDVKDVRLTLRAEVQHPRAVTRNVLGLVPGTSDEMVVLGAHYDHLGWGGQGSLAPGERAVHNGADDNASGTAVLLEVAERLAQRPPMERGVLVAFWGAEELGLLGSQHWVDHPTVPLERVVGNLNLDMVGRLESGTLTVGAQQTAAAFESALARAREAVSGRLELRVTEGAMPGGGGSDHMSFHRVELPALFFFSGLHSDYHKPSDDWEKLDFPRMAAVVDASVAFLEDLAKASRDSLAYVPPAVPERSEQGELRGARAWFGSIPDYGANPDGGGMQLAGVSPGGPAEAAGLQKGDVIKKVGSVSIGDIYDFMDSLASYRPGQTVDVEILRDAETKTVAVKLSARSRGD